MEEELFDNKQQQKRWEYFKSLIGQTFNSLTILNARITIDRRSYALCKCSCGTERFIKIKEVVDGKIKSCGCAGRFKKGLIPWNTGIPITEEHKEILRIANTGRPAWNKGIPLSEETKKKLSESLLNLHNKEEWIEKLRTSHLGQPAWNKGNSKDLTGVVFGRLTVIERDLETQELKGGKEVYFLCKCECGKTKSVRARCLLAKKNPIRSCGCLGKELMRAALSKITGEKHHNWKGGITPEFNKIRGSLKYKSWEHSVKSRDNYTCFFSGENRKSKLTVHHIANFAECPEYRFEDWNGITMAIELHQEFHRIFGFKNNTIKQLEEFCKLKIINFILFYLLTV